MNKYLLGIFILIMLIALYGFSRFITAPQTPQTTTLPSATMKPEASASAAPSPTPLTDDQIKRYWKVYTTDPQYGCKLAKVPPETRALQFPTGEETRVGGKEAYECGEKLWIL